MTGWQKTAADREREAKVYGRQYRRDRAAARRRASGYCEGCHHQHPRLEADHEIPVSQGGGHGSNLRMLCKGEGTCKCHDRKTAREGGKGKLASDPAPVQRTQW